MKRFLCRCLAGVLLLPGVPGFAVSCKTQAALTDLQRTAIAGAARQIALAVQAGRTDQLKANTVPEIAASFAGIAESASSLTPMLAGATITVDAVYLLDASDARPGEPQQQFFCGAVDGSSQTTFTIAGLPPGVFAFALVHATGVVRPQQLALLLQQRQAGGPWQLAGFFPRPLTVDGHDGLWYWRQGRSYAARKQNWNAWFYEATARFLLQPADFLSTTNLDRLFEEQEAVRPPGLPGPGAPLVIQDRGAQDRGAEAGGASYHITSLRTDDALGGYDLVAHYDSAGGDPVSNREHTLAVMRGLLALHPELREAFHGVWVFADAGPGGQAFSLEQRMEEIPRN
jgi:hypothetical protein